LELFEFPPGDGAEEHGGFIALEQTFFLQQSLELFDLQTSAAEAQGSALH
jgi:hypothetical protein